VKNIKTKITPTHLYEYILARVAIYSTLIVHIYTVNKIRESENSHNTFSLAGCTYLVVSSSPHVIGFV
jgi:hypothetical protein